MSKLTRIYEDLEKSFSKLYSYITNDGKLTFEKFVQFVLNTIVNKRFIEIMRNVILRVRVKTNNLDP